MRAKTARMKVVDVLPVSVPGPLTRSLVRLAPALLVGLASTAVGCKKDPPPPPPVPETSASAMPKEAPPPPKLTAVPRADFNRLAAELALPLFWTADENKNGALDPEELALYWGLVPGAVIGEYVGKDGFTQKFLDVYDSIEKLHKGGPKFPEGLDPKEVQRREAVLKELGQGRVTLVATDLSKATSEEKRFTGFIQKAAEYIEQLYAKQQGTTELGEKVPANDPASKTLFFRGQGPKCQAPLTENDPNCSAIPDPVKGKLSGLYPQAFLAKEKFCDVLSKNPNKAIMDPFTVVEGELATPKAVPYNETYKADMEKIAGQLKAAAEALGETEPALKAYLLADAQAFTDNKWWPADEAWAKMNAKNSKFYLRIAPDEVYDEPCSTKALFHVSFGLINQGSLKWQEKLNPLKTDMEKALADMAGPPYKAREVSFSIPDFVDIALNAGDSRKAFGATIGQSLPNFGPVANEGRGRTVAMTNFYQDPDSLAQAKDSSESLFCKDALAKWTSDQEPMLMSTVLHEAAHNLGPAHQYKANGRIDREAFGGPLASTLEELKAQTAALYFTDWLVEKNQITPDQADKAHIRDLYWGFGHISRGMYNEDHHPKNYSQLAAIQLGWFMKNGAVTWKADETAANGKDKGCFSVDMAKLPGTIKTLMVEVAQIKGRGDKGRADKLIKEFVDVTGDKKKVHDVITERLTRQPKQSFVYAIKMDAGPAPAASGSATPAGSAPAGSAPATSAAVTPSAAPSH
jgi:hypothetical protein